jgi:hypothetical protein
VNSKKEDELEKDVIHVLIFIVKGEISRIAKHFLSKRNL